MRKNEKEMSPQERMAALMRCDWYSQTNQRPYWTGSPWRAFWEAMR